jgi:hypothetical protein
MVATLVLPASPAVRTHGASGGYSYAWSRAIGPRPDVLEELGNGPAAALVLLEHRWAVGVRDTLVRAGASG